MRLCQKMKSLMVDVAIFLGASSYPKAPLLNDGGESFKRAHDRLKDELTKSLVDESKVLDLFDSSWSANDQYEQIEAFLIASKSSEPLVKNLFVFYIGHGGVSDLSQEYFLTIRDTRRASLFQSSLQAKTLASFLRKNARELRRFVVLDSCFSAAAVPAFQGAEQSVIDQKLSEIRWDAPDTLSGGTAIICAAAKGDAAKYLPDGTMFLNAFLRALYHGDASKGEFLTFEDVYELVRFNIESEHPDDCVIPELHTPDQRCGLIHKVHILKNPSWVARFEEPSISDCKDFSTGMEPAQAESVSVFKITNIAESAVIDCDLKIVEADCAQRDVGAQVTFTYRAIILLFLVLSLLLGFVLLSHESKGLITSYVVEMFSGGRSSSNEAPSFTSPVVSEQKLYSVDGVSKNIAVPAVPAVPASTGSINSVSDVSVVIKDVGDQVGSSVSEVAEPTVESLVAEMKVASKEKRRVLAAQARQLAGKDLDFGIIKYKDETTNGSSIREYQELQFESYDAKNNVLKFKLKETTMRNDQGGLWRESNFLSAVVSIKINRLDKLVRGSDYFTPDCNYTGDCVFFDVIEGDCPIHNNMHGKCEGEEGHFMFVFNFGDGGDRMRKMGKALYKIMYEIDGRPAS